MWLMSKHSMRRGASGRSRASWRALMARARALWSAERFSRWRTNSSLAFCVTVAWSARLSPRWGTRRCTLAPHHVEVLVAVGHHLLLLDGLVHAGQPVPQPGGPLELEGVGGVPHLALEAADDGPGLALEELDEVGHQVVVVGVVDLADAGG